MSEPEIGWAILELMGHRKLAGYVTDDAGLIRIDVYLEDPEQLEDDRIVRTGADPIATQWYGRGAIYCITATKVETCLSLSRSYQPAPIGRWELPAPPVDVPDVEFADELAPRGFE